MKNFIIRILKISLVFLISTIITYNCFLVKNYFEICSDYQVGNISEEDILNLDKEKIKGLGDSVKIFADLLEEEKSKNDKGDSLSDLYDPLGFSVRMQIQHIINKLFKENIVISIFIGVAVTYAYAVVTAKKLNGIVKMLIGYIGAIILFPPLYMYSWTGRFWKLSIMYWYGTPKYFYIVYTLIFVVIYFINYMVNVKLAKQLNEIVNNEEKIKD